MSKPLLISVCGGAGRFPFALRLAQRLRDDSLTKHPAREIHYAGVSSGALVSLLMALELEDEEIDTLNRRIWSALSRRTTSYWTHTYLLLHRAILQALHMRRNDWRQRLSHGKFTVVLAKVSRYATSLATVRVSRFNSPQDVAQAVLGSMHLFALFRWPVRQVRISTVNGGRAFYAMDGVFAERFVNGDGEGKHTVVVSYDESMTCFMKRYRRLRQAKKHVERARRCRKRVRDASLRRRGRELSESSASARALSRSLAYLADQQASPSAPAPVPSDFLPDYSPAKWKRLVNEADAYYDMTREEHLDLIDPEKFAVAVSRNTALADTAGDQVTRQLAEWYWHRFQDRSSSGVKSFGLWFKNKFRLASKE